MSILQNKKWALRAAGSFFIVIAALFMMLVHHGMPFVFGHWHFPEIFSALVFMLALMCAVWMFVAAES
jgi:hypothetical protein